MRRWCQAVELIWLSSGWGVEATEDWVANCYWVSKNASVPFNFLTCFIPWLWTSLFFFYRLSIVQQVPFKGNTPSIWRCIKTHTCTEKQVLSRRELSFISLESSFFFHIKVSVPQYVFRWGCVEKGETLKHGSDCDVSATELRLASRKHTCMQMSNHTRDGGTHGV